MTVFGQTLFDQSDLKIRWKEPYVSAGLNRKMQGTVPPGLYRGFIVQETSPATQSVELIVDPTAGDSVAVVEDAGDGFSTTIYKTQKVTVDLSSAFSVGGAIPGGGLTLFVVGDADFKVGVATSGDLKVVDAAELASIPSAIKVAQLTFVGAETTVLNAVITQVGLTDSPNETATTKPWASTSKLGYLSPEMHDRLPAQNEKDAMVAANSPSTSNPFAVESDTTTKAIAEPSLIDINTLVAVTSFAMPAGDYFVGTGGSGTGKQWFALFEPDTEFEFTGSDDINIPIDGLFKDVGLTSPLVPSSDADANGFYTSNGANLFVKLDFTATADSSYTGDIDVYVGLEKTISTLDVNALLKKPIKSQEVDVEVQTAIARINGGAWDGGVKDFIPSAGSTFDLGASGTTWANIFVDNLSIAGDFLPAVTNTQDIGSASLRWAEGWFGSEVDINRSVSSDTSVANYALDVELTLSAAQSNNIAKGVEVDASLVGVTDASLQIWGIEGFARATTGTTCSSMWGVEGEVSLEDTSIATNVTAGVFRPRVTGTSSATNVWGVHVIPQLTATATNAWGLEIDAISVGGTVNYGIEVGAISGSTSNYGILIGNVSGGTNNFAIETGLGTVKFGDLLQLGAIPPSSFVQMLSAATAISNGSGSEIGAQFSTSWTGTTTPTSAVGFDIFSNVTSSTANPTGIRTLTVLGSNNVTFGTVGDQVAVQSQVAVNQDGCTVVDVDCFRAAVSQIATSATVTNLAFFRAVNPNTAGTPTNMYGLLVEDIDEGTNNWAIKTGTGLVQFGDDVLPDTVASRDIGSGTLEFQDIWARRGLYNLLTGTSITPAIASDLAARHGQNAVMSVAQIEVDGTGTPSSPVITVRTNHFNVTSFTRLGVGSYSLTFDVSVHDDSAIFVTGNSSNAQYAGRISTGGATATVNIATSAGAALDTPSIIELSVAIIGRPSGTP